MQTPKLQRSIKKRWHSKPTIEGAGVHLKRAFGLREVPLLDPFLLLDDFRSENPADYRAGFPWHPHRGIDTITYVLDGDVEHADSLGNQGNIGAGDIQWMTAGSGIIHQEMPQGDAHGKMFGFQLWANLPAASKMTQPTYRDIKAKDIPTVKTTQGTVIHVISGEVDGIKGPVQDMVVDSEYLDVEMQPGQSFTRAIPRGYTAFAYVFGGEAYFDPEKDPFQQDAISSNYFDMNPCCACDDGTLVLFADGDAVSINTETKPARFLLISGKPLHQPVAWYGPIVMNTREELKQAFEEYHDGTFIKGQ